MPSLSFQAYATLVHEEQQRYEEQLRREDEERRLQREHNKRKKRLLESSFDGEMNEIICILKEVCLFRMHTFMIFENNNEFASTFE